MKKIVLLSVCLLTGIVMLFSLSGKKKVLPASIKPAAGIVDCPPPAPVLITAAAFKLRYNLEPERVRRNVDSISIADINAIKVGILKMRSLPYTDPTSWLYQAAIHGTTLPDNLQSWNSCHQPGEGLFFLAWHRMYVYFFERILRKKSGRANLTIPYWNYEINPVLHPAFRDNSRGNPLYQFRNAAINAGGALPASIMIAFSNSMDIVQYYAFQNNMNGGPHGSVHTTVNGDMANVVSAAKDPVFWIHHSNIDRIWEEWLSRCNGRANPIDSTWLNKTYTFFDEFGTPVSMKGSQVVQISAQLNYRYDVLTPDFTCPAARGTLVARQPLITKETAVEIRGKTQRADFVQSSATQLESFIRTKNRQTFNFANRPAPERLIMTFQGVDINEMPQGVMEVYLNLPSGTTPSPNSNNFVGLLDLFSAEHHERHAAPGQEGRGEIELDATKAAQALGLNINSLRTAVVSFHVRGVTLRGLESSTNAQVSIRRIQFSVDSYRN